MKTHPCAPWCGQRLVGILQNLRLRGEVSEGFDVEFRPLRGFARVPAGTAVLKCQHGRAYAVIPRGTAAASTANEDVSDATPEQDPRVSNCGDRGA